MSIMKLYTRAHTKEVIESEAPASWPIRWRELLNANPTLEEFIEAWKLIFGVSPYGCTVTIRDKIVRVDNEKFDHTYSHGGLGFHTDQPDTNENLIYSGVGVGWSFDRNGMRFCYIDENTGLPAKWEDVQANHIIVQYMINMKGKELPFVQQPILDDWFYNLIHP